MKFSNKYFIRFGGVNAKTQKGFSTKKATFHGPPASRGIYAFPIKAVELFLISGEFQGYTYEQHIKMGNKRFKYQGEIWHHLVKFVQPQEAIARKGSWVLTTFKTWERAFKKESLNNRYQGYPGFQIKSINSPIRSGVAGFVSKDHYEVFIENIDGGTSCKIK